MQKKYQRKSTDKKSRTMLRVPNTEEGKAFMKALRFYAATGTRVWARGRGPRAEHAQAVFGDRFKSPRRSFDQTLPQRFATELAVYLWKPEQQEMGRKEVRRLYDRIGELCQRDKELTQELEWTIAQRDAMAVRLAELEGEATIESILRPAKRKFRSLGNA